MTFISGSYTATYNGNSIGSTEDGFRIQVQQHHEDIRTDDYGDVPVDGVQRGVSYQISLVGMEYNLVKAAMAKQGNALGASKDNVGKLLSSLAASLVLTATSGTPAASAGNIQTLTATKAILITDFEVLLASRVRKGPLTFRLLPDPAVSGGKAYVET